MSDDGPGAGEPLLVRIWVDGELTLREEHVWPMDLQTVERHTDLAALADREGKRFLMEFEFTRFPPDERFLRFGTDPEGMVDPIEVDVNDRDAVRRIVEGGDG